jgi:hypothetical protein
MFGLKRERLAGGWSGASQFVGFVRYYLGDHITGDEVCRKCNMHRVDEKRAYNFNRQTLRDLGSLNLDGGVFERMLKK